MAEVLSDLSNRRWIIFLVGQTRQNNGPAWSWFTGWSNLLGQVAVTAGIDFGLALLSERSSTGIQCNPESQVIIIIYGVGLFIHGLLNTFGERAAWPSSAMSAYGGHFGWIIISRGRGHWRRAVHGVTSNRHHSFSTHFVNNTGFSFAGAFPIHVFFLGLLVAAIYLHRV